MLVPNYTTSCNTLHIAISTGNYYIVKTLLETAALRDSQAKVDGDSVRNSSSISDNNRKILETLLLQKNDTGLTPLSLAVCNYLNIWSEINMNQPDEEENGSLIQLNRIIDELIKRGAKINEQDVNLMYELFISKIF